MFRIKICGITRVEDARAAADAGADAIGLNFYPRSKRHVSREAAGRIVAALPAGVAKVGVFVNASAEEVRETASQLRLDWVQLHGDEPPEFLAELAGLPTIRALRCDASGLEWIEQHLARCTHLGCLPEGVLIDALAPGEYGGTGRRAPWELLTGERLWLGGRPLILAGGLVPENVETAIRTVHPAAVDTAGGVERVPGVKDHDRLQSFVEAARRAFAVVAKD